MRIGEFSQISRVTVKTLRYYDQIGILKPHQVDRFTGHRMYTIAQLSQLNRILALKALGLSLEQIQDVLDDNLSDDQLMLMLSIKKAELQQTLTDVQTQIAQLDTRIQFVRQEGKMPDYDVIIKSLPAQKVLSIRQCMDSSQIELLIHDIHKDLIEQKIESAGEWMTLYHHEGFRSTDLDVEVAVPIGDLDVADVKLSEDRVMIVRTIDAYDTVATVIEQGSNKSWQGSYGALGKWMENNKYELVLPSREVYLTDENDKASWLVEIQYPLQKT